jgi:hypothetical protein
MQGYDVVTSDDRKIGTVVRVQGDYLIVEHGKLRKTRHALPKAFAHPIDADRMVRLTVSKELVAESPKVGSDWNERAVARHYGLAGATDHPETEGAGVILPDDPAESAAVDGQRHGIKPAEQERAEIREGQHDMSSPHVSGRSPNAADPFGQTANR